MLKSQSPDPSPAEPSLPGLSILSGRNAASSLPVLEPPALSRRQTKLLLVEFRSGEAVRHHPELQPLLKEGWRIKSAVPRLVEAEGTKLLVVLTQEENTLVNRKIA